MGRQGHFGGVPSQVSGEIDGEVNGLRENCDFTERTLWLEGESREDVTGANTKGKEGEARAQESQLSRHGICCSSSSGLLSKASNPTLGLDCHCMHSCHGTATACTAAMGLPLHAQLHGTTIACAAANKVDRPLATLRRPGTGQAHSLLLCVAFKIRTVVGEELRGSALTGLACTRL